MLFLAIEAWQIAQKAPIFALEIKNAAQLLLQ